MCPAPVPTTGTASGSRVLQEGLEVMGNGTATDPCYLKDLNPVWAKLWRGQSTRQPHTCRQKDTAHSLWGCRDKVQLQSLRGGRDALEWLWWVILWARQPHPMAGVGLGPSCGTAVEQEQLEPSQGCQGTPRGSEYLFICAAQKWFLATETESSFGQKFQPLMGTSAVLCSFVFF